MGVKDSKKAKQHQESIIDRMIIVHGYAIIKEAEWNKYCYHSETSF